jgi:hypothetical protein
MQTMDNGKPADTVRSAVAALNDGDIDGYLRYFDPSGQRWVAGPGLVVTTWTYGDSGQLFRQITAGQ